jgi:hypothetical protein
MRFRVRAALFLAWLALIPAVPAAAQSYATTTFAGETLKPGQFVWYDQPRMIAANAGAEGPVSIVVSLPAQRAYVYRGGRLLGVSTVSTGSRGRETPVGEFTILQKKVFHRSNLYSNAPMPYMQRLTWDGIAIHAGHLPGYPASHGCIRLPKAFARTLYDLTEMGGSVSVIDGEVYETVPDRFGPAPLLVADARALGGDAFDVVTMRGPPPPVSATMQPVSSSSWVAGPSREVVQPIPEGSK